MFASGQIIWSTAASTPTFGVIVLAVAFGIASFREWRRSLRLRNFMTRPPSLDQWANRFPDAQRREIEEFVSIFSTAFGLPARYDVALAPDDRPMAIYRLLYPLRGEPDGLEFEDFDRRLRKRYTRHLPSNLSDQTTLADICAMIRS